MQGSWVSGKYKFYLRTVFGCSCTWEMICGTGAWRNKCHSLLFLWIGVGKPSSQINVVMWWLNLMTWEIPVLEFLRNCNNDLFLRVAFITHLLRCWLHANLGYSIICCIETEQLDLFLSVEEKQNLSKFKPGNLKMLFIILDPQFH